MTGDARSGLKGDHDWLRAGALDLGWSHDTFQTKALSDVGREAGGEFKRTATS